MSESFVSFVRFVVNEIKVMMLRCSHGNL